MRLFLFVVTLDSLALIWAQPNETILIITKATKRNNVHSYP